MSVGATDRIVGVLEDEHPSAGLLTQRPEVRFCVVADGPTPPDEVFESEVLFIWNVRGGFLRDGWSRLQRLRWVHVATAGVDRVLFPDLIDSDVVLTNSRGVFDQALAEYALGLMLILSKEFETTFAHQSEHRWVQRETDTLHGKVVVVVGVGPIARAIARTREGVRHDGSRHRTHCTRQRS